jgi:hypothetical protein
VWVWVAFLIPPSSIVLSSVICQVCGFGFHHLIT